MKRLEPLPKDPNGRKLCEIFTYLWQPILADLPSGNQKPEWKTETRYPLRPRVLWLRWQDANKLVGVRFGQQTTYAMLDIDASSPYCTPEQCDRIKAALETLGICRVLPIRSSWSGGLHLYLPLPSAVKTFDLALALHQCLTSQGFQVKQGWLEIFPNKKAFGRPWLNQFVEYNAHRLPLQPGTGSYVLDEELQPISNDIEEFLYQWEICAAQQDDVQLADAMAMAKTRFKDRHPLRHYGKAVEWRQDLEAVVSEGWTDHGQTNNLLKAIATYGRVFEQLSGDELADYVHRIAVSRPGYAEWCRHQHEISMRSRVWATAVEHYYWPFGSGDRRREKVSVNLNDERAIDAENRITQAVIALGNALQLPEEITKRAQALVEAAKVSLKTLYRHLKLWHPSEWCKIPDPASAPGDSPPDIPSEGDRVNPPEIKQFYTLGGEMKGNGRFEKGFLPVENIHPDRGGSPGGVIHNRD